MIEKCEPEWILEQYINLLFSLCALNQTHISLIKKQLCVTQEIAGWILKDWLISWARTSPRKSKRSPSQTQSAGKSLIANEQLCCDSGSGARASTWLLNLFRSNGLWQIFFRKRAASQAGWVFAQKRVIHNVWCSVPAKAISGAQLSVADRCCRRRTARTKVFSARARIAPGD